MCSEEDPFRIPHGTRTVFTEVFLGFPQCVKGNVGIAVETMSRLIPLTFLQNCFSSAHDSTLYNPNNGTDVVFK
jgi:hypothetical protein